MKRLFTLFTFLLLSFIGLNAQTGFPGGLTVPSQSDKSPLFGFDTFINNQPQQNQRNIVICSAFNGWLYATYSYFDSNVFQDALTILRSKDNGVTWSVIFDAPFGSLWNFKNEYLGLWK